MPATPLRYGLLIAVLLAGCSNMPPVSTCAGNADCGMGQNCTEGRCVAVSSTECSEGQSRPCGPAPVGACRQGTQRCVGGVFETTCVGEVKASAESCNDVDDDCDGQIDEGVTQTYYADGDGDGFGSSAAAAQTRQACTKPPGFATTNSDCDDQRVDINPSASEVCEPANVDEDCDGMRNEGCECVTVGQAQGCCAGRGTQTCDARTGGASLSVCSVMATLEVCNAVDDDCDGQTDEQFSLLAADGGAVTLGDGGLLELDGGCTVGLGACARSGAISCTSGALLCSATPGQAGVELCNSIDDDCDGLVDEVSATLCSTSGQSCTNGVCTCPQGQVVCGTSCQVIGGACSAGVGACARTGSVQCSNGNATCNAVAGTPSTEVCNAADDDCNGQVDEASSAALCSVTGQVCSSGTCNCPGGLLVCGSSCQVLGGSCSAGVGACLRNGNVACAGGVAACNASAGTAVTETCDGIDNDCDGTIDNGVTITCFPDGDNDGWATSPTSSQQCAVSGRGAFGGCPVGFVSPPASAGIDCDATNANLFRQLSTRADGDNDQYCAGAPSVVCMGTTPPAGTRLTSSCLGDDCRDTNANATTSCIILFGYTTFSRLNQCTIGSPPSTTSTVGTSSFCPTGFTVSNLRTDRLSGTEACSALSQNLLQQFCTTFLGATTTCRIVGDCLAN